MSYLGEWELIPELCLYASGEPPVSGRYAITTTADGQLSLTVAWRMAGDTADRTTTFGGPSDGTPIALPPSAAGPDSFTLSHVAPHVLDSAAHRGAQRLAYARRVCSTDCSLLAIVQEAAAPDGTVVRNFQVYRRVAG